MRVFLLLPTLLLVSQFLIAQVGNPHIGARSAALAHATVTQSDVWSVHHNQAGLAFLESPEIGISYESRFTLQELALKGLVGALPTKFGTFGINVTQFGYSRYNETKFGLAYARKLARSLSVGVQLNYLNVAFADRDYGNKGILNGEIGVRAELTEQLTLGAHVFNVSNAAISDFDDERLPVIMRLGADYQFSEKFFAAVEVEKDIDRDSKVKVGLEYKVIEQIALRAGISTFPFENSFGFGINHKGLQFDIAASYHSVLGYSPQLSLGYRF